MKIIVIGGGIAGVNFAKKIKELNSDIEVTIFEKNMTFGIDTINLVNYIKNTKKEEELIIETKESLNKLGIKVYTSSEVIEIDKDLKSIKILDGSTGNITEHNYDKLVLASGCSSKKIEEFDNLGDNLFILKNIFNANRLKKYITKYSPKNVLIVGAGPLGLEVANAMKSLNIEPTIIDKKQTILNQYDEKVRLKALELLKDKFSFILNTSTSDLKEIKKYVEEKKSKKDDKSKNNEKDLKQIKTNQIFVKIDKTKYIFDMIIVCAGVRPYTEYLKSLDINKTDNGYVYTNEVMNTSIKDIYAIGDIAILNTRNITEYILPKLANISIIEGNVLAYHLAKQNLRFKGTIASSIIKLDDIEIGKSGLNETQLIENNIQYFLKEYEDENIFLRVFFSDDLKILGTELIAKKYGEFYLSIFASLISSNQNAYDLAVLELPLTSGNVNENYILHNIANEVIQEKENILRKEKEEGTGIKFEI